MTRDTKGRFAKSRWGWVIIVPTLAVIVTIIVMNSAHEEVYEQEEQQIADRGTTVKASGTTHASMYKKDLNTSQ